MYHAINSPKIGEAQAHEIILSASTNNPSRDTVDGDTHHVYFDKFGDGGDFLARVYEKETLELVAVAMVSPSDQLAAPAAAEDAPEIQGGDE